MSRRKQGIPKKSDAADEEVNGDKIEQGGHSLLFICCHLGALSALDVVWLLEESPNSEINTDIFSLK